MIHRPEFHHLLKRVRDRINALSTFFGDGPLDVDFRGLGERAEKVRTISSKIEWIERFRTSSKTHQRHEISGFVGECTYEFPVSSFQFPASSFEFPASSLEFRVSQFECGITQLANLRRAIARGQAHGLGEWVVSDLRPLGRAVISSRQGDSVCAPEPR